jgi:hypothetical protein
MYTRIVLKHLEFVHRVDVLHVIPKPLDTFYVAC